MKRLNRLIFVILGAFLLLCTAACAEDPYRDYLPSGYEVKEVPLSANAENYEKLYYFLQETPGGTVILGDFAVYSEFVTQKFPLPFEYSESFFMAHDLLFFCALAGSSDRMSFSDIRMHEGKLYPCFLRDHINPGEGVAEDIIYLPYVAELNKRDGWKAGETIFSERFSAKYKLSVQDPSGLLWGSLKKRYPVGDEVIVKTDVVIDAGIAVYLDGVRLPCAGVAEDSERHWEYRFEMPSHNAVLSLELL